MVRVLAVDPGYDRVGVAVLSRSSGGDKLEYSDCIITDRTASLDDRLVAVGSAIASLIATHQPDRLALETLFFNKNIKTGIGVAQARGIIMYLARNANITVEEYGPQEIKVAVTGYGKSDKKAVIHMVKHLLPQVPSDKLDDEYDAIAIGITCLAHAREVR